MSRCEQNRLCALSGELLVFNRKPMLQTASLDRIDSLKGYIEGNLQWIHKDLNRSKMDYSNQEYINLCKAVFNYNKGKYCLSPS
jgi:hypothetical protein